jgi:hypothetical protein
MKYLKCSAFGILILFVTVSSLPQSRGPSNSSAELEISATKSEYLLGEPVVIERRLRTIGGGSADQLGRWGARNGEFRIAKGGGEFLQYLFKGQDTPSLSRWEARDRYKTTDTIFFNSKPVTYHLSDYGRRIAEKGMILTDYAFPEPGEYRIKSTMLFGRGGGENSERIWSNEITIRVKHPEGDDLSVWEIMNSDPRIGFFMMEGTAPEGFPWTSGDIHERALQRERVLQEVDRITSEYPNSYLAGLLKVKAQENRARRERIRQEAEKERNP